MTTNPTQTIRAADELLEQVAEEIKKNGDRTRAILAAAELFDDLADEMKERLRDALRDSGIDPDRAGWRSAHRDIREVEDVHARAVLEVLHKEYWRYRRLADEQTDSL